MNKSQKASAKVKRGKQRHTHSHTHTHTHAPSKDTNGKDSQAHQGHKHTQAKQEHTGAEHPEVDPIRRSLENKLKYLSESNQTRPVSRASGGTAGGPADAQRRRNDRKLRSQATFIRVKAETPPEEPAKVENNRLKGGYNVFLESPRRNGLTPRDPVAEAELAALMAAQRIGAGAGAGTGSGPRSNHMRRLQNVLLHEEEDGEIGHLNIKPLSTYAQAAHLPSYSCSVCGAKFHIRSLLGAHRRTHDEDFKVRFRSRRLRDSDTTLVAGNLCKFCDRRFDLERTLHIHQLTHCKKISPQQRRKLAFTELAHEKKAPLPSFQRQIRLHSQGHGHHSHRSTGSRRMGSMQHPLMQQLHNTEHERWR
ncbi:hypothetical protein KR009_003366 [Drosophila setifemur]|nr:hypothetical protein KR009_003366 [Drosophila setifemur]